MNNDDLSEQPIGWEVGAVDGRKNFVDGYKAKPHRERFPTRDLAEVRKRELQATGMVASVSPIFVEKGAQKASLKKRQTEPFGKFCKGWRLSQ